MRVDGKRRALAALTLEKRPGTQLTGDWLGTRPVWTGAENLVAIGIRSPYRPVRNESLYRLSDPGLLAGISPCLTVLHINCVFYCKVFGTRRTNELYWKSDVWLTVHRNSVWIRKTN